MKLDPSGAKYYTKNCICTLTTKGGAVVLKLSNDIIIRIKKRGKKRFSNSKKETITTVWHLASGIIYIWQPDTSVKSKLDWESDAGPIPLFAPHGPGEQTWPMIGAKNDPKPQILRPLHRWLHDLLFPLGHLYLRILCASILRFWLLEHTTATRSGWLGIATFLDETN